jgi:hypothetical protein
MSGPVTYGLVSYANAPGSPFTLSSAWTKVATTDATTKALRVGNICTATIFDIEWASVPAGAAAPADANGEAVLGGEDFDSGVPLGDVYLRSPSGQTAIVRVGT